MTIDPLTIPCPFCGGHPIVKDWRWKNNIYCRDCEISLAPEEWIEGGINALVGKLLRFGVSIWRSEGGWTWDDDYDIGGSGPTLEACVLDAWEKMEMREGEG